MSEVNQYQVSGCWSMIIVNIFHDISCILILIYLCQQWLKDLHPCWWKQMQNDEEPKPKFSARNFWMPKESLRSRINWTSLSRWSKRSVSLRKIKWIKMEFSKPCTTSGRAASSSTPVTIALRRSPPLKRLKPSSSNLKKMKGWPSRCNRRWTKHLDSSLMQIVKGPASCLKRTRWASRWTTPFSWTMWPATYPVTSSKKSLDPKATIPISDNFQTKHWNRCSDKAICYHCMAWSIIFLHQLNSSDFYSLQKAMPVAEGCFELYVFAYPQPPT